MMRAALYALPSTINQRTDLTYYFNWIQWFFFFMKRKIVSILFFWLIFLYERLQILLIICDIFCRLLLHESEKIKWFSGAFFAMFCLMWFIYWIDSRRKWQTSNDSPFFRHQQLFCFTFRAFSFLRFIFSFALYKIQINVFFWRNIFHIKLISPLVYTKSLYGKSAFNNYKKKKKIRNKLSLWLPHASNLLSGGTAYKDASIKKCNPLIMFRLFHSIDVDTNLFFFCVAISSL